MRAPRASATRVGERVRGRLRGEPMSIDIVRGELERLFSLDELLALSSDLLGFDPAEVGGSASKASFARALTDRCVELHAVEALLEAVLASRKDIDPRI